jgi:hypothetical protein
MFKRGFTRLGRAIGLDRNPLRRATDRTEAWIRAGLVAVFLIAGPMTALAAGHWAGQARLAAAQLPARPAHLGRAAPARVPTIAADLYGSAQPNQAGAGTRRAAGRPVHGPAVLVEGLTLVVMTLALTGALWLARALLTRRRLAAWEAAWSRIGPQWSRNRP